MVNISRVLKDLDIRIIMAGETSVLRDILISTMVLPTMVLLTTVLLIMAITGEVFTIEEGHLIAEDLRIMDIVADLIEEDPIVEDRIEVDKDDNDASRKRGKKIFLFTMLRKNK